MTGKDDNRLLSCRSLGEISCGARATRRGERWQVIVVVKAAFAMVHDAPMMFGDAPRLAEPDFLPIRAATDIGFAAKSSTSRITVFREGQPVSEAALGHLTGDEWLEIADEWMRVRSGLPNVRGLAMVGATTEAAATAIGASGEETFQPLPLVADQILVRPDVGRLSVCWRGRFEIDDSALLDDLTIVGAVSRANERVAWPTPGEGVDVGPKRPIAPPPLPQAHGTGMVTLMDSDGLAMTLDPETITAATGRRIDTADPVPPELRTITLTDDIRAEVYASSAAPFDLARPGTSNPEAPAGAPFSSERAPNVLRPDAGAEATLAPFSGLASRPDLGAAERFFKERESEAPRRSAVPKRITEAIPVANDTALEITYIAWQHRPPQDSLTIVVKGTFELLPGGAASPSEETAPLTGDVDEEGGASLRYASDFALFKPAADVTLVGHAHARDPKGVRAAEVRFLFGHRNNAFDRRVAVFGSRVWERGVVGLRPGASAPFTKVPLSYEQAFGGMGSAANPVGRGRDAASGGMLPHLEHPRALIDGARAKPPPACFAPIHPLWEPRSKCLGTYDDSWLKTRWPYYPIDFDWRHFQSAPEGQQLDYLSGDEPFAITGVHPKHAVIEGTLPGLTPRCFMVTSGSTIGAPGAEHAFERVVLHLDTVAFDTDAMQVHLVWRGVVLVSDEDAPEIEWLYLAADGAGDDTADTELYARFLTHVMPLVALEAPSPPANDVGDGGGLAAEMDEVRRETSERVAGLGALAGGPIARMDLPVPQPLSAADDERLEGGDLAGADLRTRDFSGRDLRGINLQGAILRGSMFTAANLQDALLAGADLRDTVFDAANLIRADLTGANLEGASFVGAAVEDMNASDARGDGASFQLARGPRLVLSRGSWNRSRFEGADLERLDLSGSKFRGARFANARLSMCRLFDADGADSSFNGADVTDALCDGVAMKRADLGGVTAGGSCWEGAELDGCNFLEAMLDDASFVRASLVGADLSACSLRRARMKRVAAARAKLVKSNLEEAQLERGDLSGADLTGANLYGAELWLTNLDAAVLTDAHLARTKRER